MFRLIFYRHLLLITIAGLINHSFAQIRADQKNHTSLKDTKIISAISTLPFGCPSLITHKFPKQWDVPTIDGYTPKKPISRHQKELEKVRNFYDRLNAIKPISAPQIKHTKYLNADHDDSLFIKDIQKFKIRSVFKYRLPDIGDFQCYYQTFDIPGVYSSAFSTDSVRYLATEFLDYGNLVLYNPKTKQANVLNIYYSSTNQERFGTDYKFFFINTKKTVQIFTAEGNEESSGLEKHQEITILSNGGILIKTFK